MVILKKTTTAEQQASTIIYMDDPLYKEQNLRMADINPKALLVGEFPILVDEWQLAPKLWFRCRPICMADHASHELIRVGGI